MALSSDHDEREKPSFRKLADWLEGRLTRDSAATMDGLTDLDDETRSTIEWLRNFRRFGRNNPIPQPPPLVRQRLRQEFERHHGRGRPMSHQVAGLTFDSRDDVVMAGVRGVGDTADGYQLTFTTPSHGVLVEIMPTTALLVRIEGQVLGIESEAPVWEVVVEHPRGSIVDINGDENGSFAVSDVPLNAELMRLSNGETTIEVPNPLGEAET